MKLQIDPAYRVKLMTHDEAWLYCACYYHNKKSDWRLPTTAEYNAHDNIFGWTDMPNFIPPAQITSHFTPVRTK